jgi:protein-tyrosine phosphatase
MSIWFERFGFDRVAPGLVMGAMPLDEEDLGQLTELGVDAIYNLCEDGEYLPGQRLVLWNALSAARLLERRLPFADHGRLDGEELDRAAREVGEWIDADRQVYLHCRAGQQRSAAVAAAVIAIRTTGDIDAALDEVARQRPGAVPLRRQRKDLVRWWRKRGAEAA